MPCFFSLQFKDKVPDWMLLPLTKAQLSGEILIGLLQGLKEVK